MEVIDLIRGILRLHGWDQKRLAEALGVQQPTVSRWLTGSDPRGATHARIRELALDLGIIDESDPAPGFAAGVPYKPKIPGARPEIDAMAGAGHGTVGEAALVLTSGGTVTGHRVIEEWLLPEMFMRHELRTLPDATVLMEVKGDSMAPTLQPGERVIVDTGQTRFGVDAIYIINDGDGEPRVKRLLKLHFSDPPQVAIVSDNPRHKEQTASLEDLRILGRVVGRISRL